MMTTMQRWQEISNDPNAPEVMDMRRAAIAKARTGALIYDRVAYLCQLAAGKSVLDIGVVEHTREAAEGPNWLHGHLHRHANRCLGVDVLEAEVEHLKARGYEVLCADITQAPLPLTFDVIIGGEVLEHLNSPGMFMKNCAAMLAPGGRLIITVPNPWYINAIIKSCRRRTTFVDSADHVAWYEASTLCELGLRHGLRLDHFVGIGLSDPKTLRAKIFLYGLKPALIGLGCAPELFSKSIIYEFVLA
ncbi:MAG: class I SAM-dependent methyltransferase [Acidobacteriota bacterium]